MIRYDGREDALHIHLSDGEAVAQREVKPGVILHLGPNDKFLAVEIREASNHIPLRDLGQLVLRQSAHHGQYKAVLELPQGIRREDYDLLIEATQAEGWEVAPARRRLEAEAAMAASSPKALLFVRRKQPV